MDHIPGQVDRAAILKLEKESAIRAFNKEKGREPNDAQELLDYMIANRPPDYKEVSANMKPVEVPPAKVKEYLEKYEAVNGATPDAKTLEEFMNTVGHAAGDNFIPVHQMGLPLPDGVTEQQMIQAEDTLRLANGGREPTQQEVEAYLNTNSGGGGWDISTPNMIIVGLVLMSMFIYFLR